jgi:hypothetical protein
MRFAVKSVEMAKMKIKPLEVHSNALGAFDHTTVECMSYIRTYSSLAREVRVALAAIANLLALWDFRAVIYGRTHILRLNAGLANALHTVERTRDLRSNALHKDERMRECVQMQNLRSNTPLTWQHDLVCL